jgi:hypothetical protein
MSEPFSKKWMIAGWGIFESNLEYKTPRTTWT